MTRLAISVEGQTEEAFVKELLRPHLEPFGVWVTPVNLFGNIKMGRVVPELARLLHAFDAVTTLYDYYGFSHRPCNNVVGLEAMIGEAVEARLAGNGRSLDQRRLRPYVQLHEFEALLFADVQAFRLLPESGPRNLTALEAIRAAFASPEAINDSPHTAPSKRLEAQDIGYDKVAHGPLIALEIGLAAIRAACPRFDAWVVWLEAASTL